MEDGQEADYLKTPAADGKLGMGLKPPVNFSLFQLPLQADLFPQVFVLTRVMLWGQVQLCEGTVCALQCPATPGNAKAVGCVVSAGGCRALSVLHQCIRYGGSTGQEQLLCRKPEVFG